jgi:hypothetical protein
VILDIEDNGPGLSAEQQQMIFEPFFTTKVKGPGLGMSIVQRILHAHGGDIQIAEPVQSGARFLIRLGKQELAFDDECTGSRESVDA